MSEIQLKYGHSAIPFKYDPARLTVLASGSNQAGLTDVEIGDKLDAPIASPRLEDLISPDDTVLIVVPDATRQTGCGQVVNLIVRRLIANGIVPANIRIIFATGIHRKVTVEEKSIVLTRFIAQRIATLDHDPRDLMRLYRVGELDSGTPVELNVALIEHDHIIAIGGVSFHYFAGFTGGRKLICPGLASAKTISATHKLAFDCETLSRRTGVGNGLLEGNAVHLAFVEAAELAAPRFAISTITNNDGAITDLFCGDRLASHLAACNRFGAANTVAIAERREAVVVSCGGYPHDINMIQAHKALEAGSNACIDGGTMILLAECADGLGHDDFLQWFNAADSDQLGMRLCKHYKVNGQTAWSLLRKNERFNVDIVSSLDPAITAQMRFRANISGAEAMKKATLFKSGYILPNGAKLNIRTT